MNEYQQMLFDMLEWFHKYCKANNLKYYLLGGTLLGAMRHKGFIPWDDDIDLGLPRKDYNELISSLEGKQGRYILESPYSNNTDFCYPFSKLYDTETTLIENKRYAIKRGIYLDIFPLDGIGNNKAEVQRRYAKIKGMYDFYLTRTGGIRKGRTWYKNLAIVLMTILPEKILNPVNLRRKLDEECAKLNFGSTKYVGNALGAWGSREFVRREVFGKPTLYQFEGAELYGPEYGDKYLTHVYGEWRKLPPKEKQVSHHDYIEFDLHKSFLR